MVRLLSLLLLAGLATVPPAFVDRLPGWRRPWRWRTLGRKAFADELISWAEAAGHTPRSTLKALGGSDWSRFYRLKTETGELFVKSSSREAAKMFAGEAAGLRALSAAAHSEGLLRVPKVLYVGDRTEGSGSFIVLEYLELGGPRDSKALGRAMASLHAEERSSRFGFEVNNTIGETPQRNPWSDDWVAFYRDHRLGYQVDMADDGYLTRLFNAVSPRLPELFDGVDVRPSILHGDFWTGNIGVVKGKPAIFDPAAYYGHHEAEWGMSWCASLSDEFWEGYRERIPEQPGFEARRPLYQAYHQINHYNLFGGGYLNTAIRCLETVKRTLEGG